MGIHHPHLLRLLTETIIDEMAKSDACDVNHANDLPLDFQEQEAVGIVPKNASSSCKRVCMFLRWMVRTDSPVDLGIWSDLISLRSLIMPLDTHVIQQSLQLGLITSKTTSMSVARKLTDKLLEIFPDDPLKADFALFGYGVNQK